MEKAVRQRIDINTEIAKKWELISEIKSEIISLKREAILLCDESQWFEEKEEEITISQRPKKIEKRVIGRIYWNQDFIDEHTNEIFTILRDQVVRVDGIWCL